MTASKDSYPVLGSTISSYQPQFDREYWSASCACGWAAGGYDTKAEARRGLSQHQSQRHPGQRG